jgi:hypothetical protein
MRSPNEMDPCDPRRGYNVTFNPTNPLPVAGQSDKRTPTGGFIPLIRVREVAGIPLPEVEIASSNARLGLLFRGWCSRGSGFACTESAVADLRPYSHPSYCVIVPAPGRRLSGGLFELAGRLR